MRINVVERAREYALKIFLKYPNYSLATAKRIFGKYYFLVENCYYELESINDKDREIAYMLTGKFIKEYNTRLAKINRYVENLEMQDDWENAFEFADIDKNVVNPTHELEQFEINTYKQVNKLLGIKGMSNAIYQLESITTTLQDMWSNADRYLDELGPDFVDMFDAVSKQREALSDKIWNTIKKGVIK